MPTCTLSRLCGSVLLALCLVPSDALRAQSSPDPTWGFVSVRYSGATAGFLLGGYGHGPVFGLVGMANNPRAGHTELLGGLGIRFALGAATSHAVVLATSRAAESRSTQLYYLPAVTLGRATAEATLRMYMPGSASGAKQFGINPVSVFIAVGSGISVGGSYQLALQEGAGPKQGAGAAVRLTVPKGALTLDLLRGVRAFPDEARASFRAFF